MIARLINAKKIQTPRHILALSLVVLAACGPLGEARPMELSGGQEGREADDAGTAVREGADIVEGGARRVVVTGGARIMDPAARDAFDDEAAQRCGGGKWPTLRAPGTQEICIVSHSTASMQHYARVAAANHAAYAERHGYLYGHYEGVLDSARFRDPQDEDIFRRFGFYWHAFAAVEDALAHQFEDGSPLCRWVMWVDADVVMTRFDLSVGDLLASEGVDLSDLSRRDVAVILSRQEWHDHTHVQAGVYLVHNGPRGRAFVGDVIGRHATNKSAGCPDQTAIEDFAFNTDGCSRQEFCRRPWAEAKLRLRSDVVMVRQRAMNSFHGYPIDDTDLVGAAAYAWQEGDFAAHFAGPKSAEENSDRIAALKDLAQRGT